MPLEPTANTSVADVPQILASYWWCRLVENGGEGVGTGEHGRWVVQIMTGFLNSHQAGSTIVDVPK